MVDIPHRSHGAKELPWHTDTCWGRLRQFLLLDAMEVPSDGGATYWADTYSAFERLPPDERRHLSSLRVVARGNASDVHDGCARLFGIVDRTELIGVNLPWSRSSSGG